jgi:hypothetical protein
MTVSRWLDERLDNIGFRLRLLRMALSPLGRVPAAVVMALESPDYRADWLDGPDGKIATGEPGAPAARWL